MTEAERYLAKARESLASAEADVVAGRYNSVANRAYYAAFQAAVAALIHCGIRPESGNWQHRFVLSQFSGKLVKRRKLLEGDLPGVIDDLFATRIIGDYEPADVSRSAARNAKKMATRIVSEVERMTKLHTFREASATYESEFARSQERLAEAELYVNELQNLIRRAVPEAEFHVIRLGPTDYRVHTYVDSERERKAVRKAIGNRAMDILSDHDVWIVVLAEVRSKAS
ncbi:MAG: HEPN domain-containing protein [Dehalococcoidia bacterium]